MDRNRRSAFTLIELLVVIAIIAILIALLVPAVQKVRESAARAQCQNNVKQIGVAFHNYHSVNKRFPPGATDTWRAGWATLLLPYLDQAGLFEQLNLNASTYVPAAGFLFNRDKLKDVVVPAFVCPIDTLPRLLVPEDAVPAELVQVGNYVGIMGAVTDTWNFQDPTGGGRAVDCSAANPFEVNKGGYIAYNGVLYAGKGIPIAQIGDGTSNTIMLGEQSDWGSDPGVGPFGSNPRREMRMAARAGLWTGAAAGNTTPPTCWMESASLITVRHRVNVKARFDYRDGMGRYGWNTPIQSAHHGGAFVLRCDGGAGFLSATTSWDVLRWLSIRDDGQAFQEPGW